MERQTHEHARRRDGHARHMRRAKQKRGEGCDARHAVRSPSAVSSCIAPAVGSSRGAPTLVAAGRLSRTAPEIELDAVDVERDRPAAGEASWAATHGAAHQEDGSEQPSACTEAYECKDCADGMCLQCRSPICVHDVGDVEPSAQHQRVERHAVVVALRVADAVALRVVRVERNAEITSVEVWH